MAKKLLVCSDRDGTINDDKDYYLGKSPNWKEQIKFIPHVVQGIKLLNKIPDSEVFIITNQSGVAIYHDKQDSEFPNLTEERMCEVNEEILKRLNDEGARIKGYFACPFVDLKYVQSAFKKGRVIDKRYIAENHPDRKPNIGMIEKAARSLGRRMNECDIWTIGDRFTDIQTGLKAGGRGILIESNACIEDIANSSNASSLFPNSIFLALNFYKAAQIIADTYNHIHNNIN